MEISSKTAVAILSIYSFPDGLAPTIRILSYSKGLIENGASVDVFNPFSQSKTSGFEPSKNGIFQGISYHFTYRGYKITNKTLRKLTAFTGYRRIKTYILSAIKIYSENKFKKFKCIIISSDSLDVLFIYSNIARILRFSPIFIFDEYPTPIRHKLKNRVPRWKEFLYKLVLKKVGAYISISENLRDYYCKLVSKQTYILPIITDTSRFNIDTDNNNASITQKYLCYMGNMELAKDDLANIIRAFSLITDKFEDLYLYLYGDPSNDTKTKLNHLIVQLQLQNRVIIKGKANYADVPIILKQAYILVSSQPDTKRASGGFPTKLGEYLASGTPALITDVGENSKYVKDNIHIFFTKPGDFKVYAQKLIYIIDNYDHALSVAKNGQKFLQEHFSHTKKGCELLEFVSEVYHGEYEV